MDERKGTTAMPIDDVNELMKLMGWSKTRLAAELEITSSAIDKWIAAGHSPGGPVGILLKDWLIRARCGEPLRATEHKHRRNGKHAVPA